MRMLQSILFATDFLSGTEDARKPLLQLASAFASQVTLLHALPPADSRERADQQIHKLTQELLQQKVGVLESSVVVGSAADAIIRKAQEIDTDLILMGTGEQARYGHPAGPVAQMVVQRAFQPVLAIRPEQPALLFRRILCPVDYSPVSRRGLENAIRLAQTFAGEVIVLQVASSGGQSHTGAEPSSDCRNELDDFLKGADFGRLQWQREVRSGRAHEEIIKAAHDHRADLLVMGSCGRSGRSLVVLGSVTRRVLQQLPCSLLVVKHEDLLEELLIQDIQAIRQLMVEGRQLLGTGHYAEAAGKFRQVLVENPFLIGALENLAAAYSKLHRTEEAKRYQRRAAALRNA